MSYLVNVSRNGSTTRLAADARCVVTGMKKYAVGGASSQVRAWFGVTLRAYVLPT
jgi:hypothetical protein